MPAQSAAAYPDTSSTRNRASASAVTMPAAASCRATSPRAASQVSASGVSLSSFMRARPPAWLASRRGELTRPLVGGQRVDDVVELAREHAIERVHGEPDPVIGDAVLLVVVRADLLGPPASLHLIAAHRAELRVLAVLFQLHETRAQDAHRFVLVLQMALLVLARDDQPARHVRDAHRRVGGVHGLPAGPGRPVHVDL